MRLVLLDKPRALVHEKTQTESATTMRVHNHCSCGNLRKPSVNMETTTKPTTKNQLTSEVEPDAQPTKNESYLQERLCITRNLQAELGLGYHTSFSPTSAQQAWRGGRHQSAGRGLKGRRLLRATAPSLELSVWNGPETTWQWLKI